MVSATRRCYIRCSDEVPATGGVRFNACRSVGPINESAIRKPVVRRVKSDAREVVAVVGFPFVDLAVAVAVFFGARDDVLVVVLDAVDPAVALRRELRPGD